MNPDEVAYDISQMVVFLDDVMRCQKVLTGEEEDLNQLLRRTLGSDWTGSASGAWQARQNDWNTACAELNGILANLAAALETAIHNASATNAGLTRMWAG